MDEEIRLEPYEELKGTAIAQAGESHSEKEEPLVRRLTREEIDELRRDMKEASAWMRAELKRRKAHG